LALLLPSLSSAEELTLTPPPTVEGLYDSQVTLDVKMLDIGKDGMALKEYLSIGYESTNLYLLELTSNEPFWLDYSSSMGANSRKELIEWVQNTLLSKYKENGRTNHIEEHNSLLSALFGGARKKDLKEGVGILAEFIGRLIHPYEDKATIDRSFYSTSFKICPFSQRLFSFIIVDPEPFSGPEKKSYLVIIENVYEE